MRVIRFIDGDGHVRYGHDQRDGAAAVLGGDPWQGLSPTQERAQVSKLLAPAAPGTIFCTGLNYHQHAIEMDVPAPERPIVFMKNPASLQHPSQPIVLPACCMDPPEVDFEIELAVVLARSTKNVSPDDALDHVLGYTVANDVSARLWQKQRGGGQWVRAKSFDTFCPLGPVLATKDEIPDPQNLRVTTKLNGEMMQQAHTADMIFGVSELIAYFSQGTTLPSGTVLLTGSPPGVGVARDPQVFLQPGDTVEMEIEGIGKLVNPVTGKDGN